MPSIFFNGKSYNSVEEMSLEDRQAYEKITGMFMDKNGNGIPDFLEGDIIGNISTIYNSASKFTVNGNVYNNINELPPDVQAQVKGAFEKMNELGVVPDRKAEILAERQSLEIERDHQFTSKPYMPPQNYSAIQDGNKASILQWILLGLVLFFCLALGAFGMYFFLQQ